METDLPSLQRTLQDALDDLTSHRSSTETRNAALSGLEYLLALACVRIGVSVDPFFALQDTFECNIPSRLGPWIASSTIRLEHALSKGSTDEATLLSAKIVQALGIIQGVVLNHPASKTHMGRKYTVEILVDLLLASRHLYAFQDEGLQEDASGPPSLSSIVLDTLLYILVDSSPAIRAFEQVNGVQVVVKILKRAGTPKETRMKCIEFLYFWLLPETTEPGTFSNAEASAAVAPYMTSPRKPAFLAHPREASNSSSSSFTSSLASETTDSSFTTLSSMNSTRVQVSDHRGKASIWPSSSRSRTPSPSPSSRSGVFPEPPRSLLMLKREVDFIPLSPKKPSVRPRTPEHEDCGPLPSLTAFRSTSDRPLETPRKKTAQLGNGVAGPSGAAKSTNRLSSSTNKPGESRVAATPRATSSRLAPGRVASGATTRVASSTPRVASSAQRAPGSRLVSTSGGAGGRVVGASSSRLVSSSSRLGSSVSSRVQLSPEKKSAVAARLREGDRSGPSLSPEKAKLAASTRRRGEDTEDGSSASNSSAMPTTPTRKSRLSNVATPRASQPAAAAVHTPRAKSNPVRLTGPGTPGGGLAYERSYSVASPGPARNGARTTEEKKILLGSMLGNVDALVDGVRKAGVWGLG